MLFLVRKPPVLVDKYSIVFLQGFGVNWMEKADACEGIERNQ